MLTRLHLHLFSVDSPFPPDAGARRRSLAGQAAAGLTGLLWLPAAVAAVGLAVSEAALPLGARGWACLVAGGLPLGLAWFLLGSARSAAIRTAFAVLAPLGVLAYLAAAGAGPVAQAAAAAAMSLPVWVLFLLPRRSRRSAVCVENTVWRVGTVTW